MKNYNLILITLILAGAFLRFYNLDWGSPFSFHPDERNIASSISQLRFPSQINPHFFAYGSFPIYLMYLTGVILNRSFDVPFSSAIFISRFYAAILSTLLIPLAYVVGNKLRDKNAGLLAATLSMASVGFMQFAHFGTFEMWTAFLSLWLFYFSIKLTTRRHWEDILTTGILLGLLLAVKISNFILLPIPFVALFLAFFSTHTSEEPIQSPRRWPASPASGVASPNRGEPHGLLRGGSLGAVIVFLAFVTFSLTSPFVFLDFSSFLSSMDYESSAAFGKLSVFYTGSFYDTTPILFQFTKIYPFLLNPLITFLSVPSLLYTMYISFKKRNTPYSLLLATYFLLFLSQAFLFAKWTRYMVPTLPFVYPIIALALASAKRFVTATVIVLSFFFGASYFVSVHTNPDTRIEAASWAKERIPHDARILSEVYDMGITAFNPHFSSIALFNFYDLDKLNTSDGGSPELVEGHDSSEVERLKRTLAQTQYIVLPSQRILKTRLDSKRFPNGNRFYKQLFNDALGFTKIYETPCDVFCRMTYLGNPLFSLEETTNVFDRPTVLIFKRQ